MLLAGPRRRREECSLRLMTDQLLATYIHDLGPFLWQIKGNFGIRWYGFMYVVGFLAAYLLLRWFVKLRACELRDSQVGDFITLVALLGVMLGGRLGYMLLYRWDELLRDPISIFKVLNGGMASHGAILGITAVVFFYARWKKISWLGLGDNIVITGPLGVFFGRWGNFINGELYGRKTDHAWGMKFPSEIHDLPYSQVHLFLERAEAIVPGILAQAQQLSQWGACELVIATSRTNPEFKQLLGDTLLNTRHPSQIYQSLCEGLLVFLILLAIRVKWRNAYHGVISGVFFIIYAIARIAVENLREPDSALVMGITKGQFYSLFFFAIGIAILSWALYRKRQNAIPQ